MSEHSHAAPGALSRHGHLLAADFITLPAAARAVERARVAASTPKDHLKDLITVDYRGKGTREGGVQWLQAAASVRRL